MTPARLAIAIALGCVGAQASAEPPGGPATTATQVGDTTYFSDGTRADRVGNTLYFSDGRRADQVGDTTYFSDGSRADRVGNVLYRSDGTTCTQVGERTECDAPRAPINAARPPSRRWPPTD